MRTGPVWTGYPDRRSYKSGVRENVATALCRLQGVPRRSRARVEQGDSRPVNIYVGNLPFQATNGDLETLFSTHGAVQSANVISDRETGRSRGFGFVEMDDDNEARKAIDELDGHDLNGRRLRVNEARPRR